MLKARNLKWSNHRIFVPKESRYGLRGGGKLAYLDESHKWKRTFIVVFLRNNPAPIERLIEGLNKDLQSKPEENNRLKKEAYRWKNRVWFEHLTGSEARIWKPTQEITTNTNTARICLPSISILFWKRSEHSKKREMKALVNPRNVERVEGTYREIPQQMTARATTHLLPFCF